MKQSHSDAAKRETFDNPPPYLLALTLRLAHGVAELPVETRRRASHFFESAQRADGGFAGREGESDPYYTAFAVRSLALLGRLKEEVARRIGNWLRGQFAGDLRGIDFFSLVFAAQLVESASGIRCSPNNEIWRRDQAERIESLRREDGGYARSREGAASSTYHSFLSAIVLEILDQPLQQPDRLARFTLSQRRDDGGFVEIRAMRRSGANPTAAAVGLLKTLIQEGQPSPLDEATRSAATCFLLGLQTEEGGFKANTVIPVADLLSTFTCLLTLLDLGAASEVGLADVRRFVESLHHPKGGFLAAVWDDTADVEYSFYGLATLGLLETVAR